MDERTARTVQTYNAVAEHYHEINQSVEPVRDLLETFVRYLPGPRVLDVGCGPGRDSRYFAGQGLHVTGVDLTPRFAQIAQAYVPEARFALADMRRLPFAPAAFDGLWVCASLLHLPRQEAPAALAGFRQLLRPGGVIYIGVQQGEGEGLVAARGLGGWERFFSYYDAPGLRTLLLEAGFTLLTEIITPDSRIKGKIWLNAFAQPAH